MPGFRDPLATYEVLLLEGSTRFACLFRSVDFLSKRLIVKQFHYYSIHVELHTYEVYMFVV